MSVAVVVPARDEERTVGQVVGRLRRQLVEHTPLVDELVVVDSASTDATAAVAAAAGARVVRVDEPGKGRALQAGVAATSADVLLFVDADLRGLRAATVAALLGPLLEQPEVVLVKAAYERPGSDGPGSGGRVTELLVRPLLAARAPELAAVLQPLGGEYAARRDALERLPFAAGYGVELGLLLDTVDAFGLDAVAQVDLGRRAHRRRPTPELGPAAAAVLRVALRRLGGTLPADDAAATLVQWRRSGTGWRAVGTDVTEPELPPLRPQAPPNRSLR